ncbi:MAG TPA: alpha/beta hydrolase [Mycobacteriales bacterium]|nr:alpha/beta hydrolase [Mycobacteriales bacterium]
MGEPDLEPLGSRTPVAGGIDLDLPGDGVRLAATRWPVRHAGSGPPVVLLHGLASQRRFWNLVVPELSGFPLLALDARGHGDSERPASGYDTEQVVADVATALDALGIDRAVVVGHSWGAAIALTFAAKHPERTLAAVALDGGLSAPGGVSPADRGAIRERMAPPRVALPPTELAGLLAHGPLAPWWSPELEAAILPVFGVGPDGLARARFPWDAHMQVVDALLDYDAAAVFAGIRCPAWLVSCEAVAGDEEIRGGTATDWAVQKNAGLEIAATALAQPRLFRWGGALHDVPLQWPALVAGLVRAAAADTAVGRG